MDEAIGGLGSGLLYSAASLYMLATRKDLFSGWAEVVIILVLSSIIAGKAINP